MKAKIYPLPKAGPAPRQRFDTAPKIPTMTMACVLAGAACITTLIPYTAHAQEAVAQQSFNIPAGKLSDALARFAAAAGVPLSFEPQMLGGRESDGLEGHYSVQEGFAILLAGSGYQLVSAGSGGYALQEISADTTTLPPVRVSAGTIEEKTGSVQDGYVASEISGVGPWKGRSLQDTPYSMSVVSDELIENNFVTDMDQLVKINPVVQLSRSSSFDDTQSPTIRGFGVWSQVVDGMSLSAPPQGISFEEVERIEVLSGLSGFLYGSGNVGGTVNYVLKRPTKERLARLTGGNYGGSQYFAHADLGGPIDKNGTFGYRLNLMHQDGETAVEGQDKEETLASSAFDWNVTDDLLVQLEASHREYKMQRPSASFDFRNFDGFPDAFDASESYTPEWNHFDNETDRISLGADWRINDSFDMRAGYLRKEHNWYLSDTTTTFPRLGEDGESFSTLTIRYAPQERINDAAHVYLDGDISWGDIDHNLTIGISGDVYDSFGHETGIAYNPSWSSPPTVSLDELDSLERPDLSFDKGKKYKSSRTTSRNIIVGDDIAINDQWSMLAGVNYTTLGSYSYNVDGEETQSYKESEWTPTFSLIHKPLENFSTYATYMEALENGTIVGENYTNAGEVLDPLVSKQYEIGAKYDLNDRALLSTSLFRIEKANQFSDGSEPLPTYVQDGLQVHQGVEFLLTGKVSGNLTLHGGFTVMDLKVEDANDPVLEGKEPTNVAPKTAKLYAEYTVPGIQGLVLTGGAYYTGERYADSANTKEVDAYILYDLGARYSTAAFNKSLTLRLSIANLTDEDYWASASEANAQLGIPRTISFSASMDF